MIVQFNTDHNITASETMSAGVIARITDELSHYSSHITRVEAHLTEENGHKEGVHDKRCVLEARVEGHNPIAVTNHAANNHEAVGGAISKLKSALETVIGKARNH
jgi:hypothetical protein